MPVIKPAGFVGLDTKRNLLFAVRPERHRFLGNLIAVQRQNQLAVLAGQPLRAHAHFNQHFIAQKRGRRCVHFGDNNIAGRRDAHP